MYKHKKHRVALRGAVCRVFGGAHAAYALQTGLWQRWAFQRSKLTHEARSLLQTTKAGRRQDVNLAETKTKKRDKLTKTKKQNSPLISAAKRRPKLFKAYNSRRRRKRETVRTTSLYRLRGGTAENCQNGKSSWIFRREALRQQQKKSDASRHLFTFSKPILSRAAVGARKTKQNQKTHAEEKSPVSPLCCDALRSVLLGVSL